MGTEKKTSVSPVVLAFLLIMVLVSVVYAQTPVIDLNPNLDNYFLELARGNIDGQKVIHKFGSNFDINPVSGFEALWTGGANYTGFDSTVAEIVEVFSSNAVDTDGGIGARQVLIFGLDNDFLEIQELVMLNGTTPVNTVNSYRRLNRMQVNTSGTTLVNQGEITARASITTSVVFAVIAPSFGQTLIAAYTIPANKEGYFQDWYASIASKKDGFNVVRLVVRPFGGAFQVREEVALSTDGTSYLLRSYTVPKDDLPPKTDIFILSDASVTNMGVSGGFDIILVDI